MTQMPNFLRNFSLLKIHFPLNRQNIVHYIRGVFRFGLMWPIFLSVWLIRLQKRYYSTVVQIYSLDTVSRYKRSEVYQLKNVNES